MPAFTGYTLHSIAAYAEGYYSIPLVLTSCTYSNGTFYCYRRDNQEQIQIAHFDTLEDEVVFDWIGSGMPIMRTEVSKFTHDIQLEKLLGEEERIAKQTSLDTAPPVGNNFEAHPVEQARDIMEIFLPITKETIVGDVIIVPEHRCDIHDTQAQMASQFMAAYGIDSMRCHVYSGVTITFRKAD